MKSLVWIKEKTPTEGPSPSPRDGHSLTYIPEIKSVILFGGNHNSTKSNEIYIYDIDKNVWRLQTTTGKQPSPRAYHSAFIEGIYFFVYGGQGESGKSLNDLNFLNVLTWEWKLLFIIEAPPARHHTTLCDLGNPEKEKIIFGGVSTTTQEKLLNDLWVISYPTTSFNSVLPKIPGTVCISKKAKGDVPPPRKGHCAATYNKYMFVYGGFTEDPEDSNGIYQLIFENWTWKKVAGVARPLSSRYFMTSCIYDRNILLLFGGIDTQTKKHLNDVAMIDLEEFRWSSPYISGHLPMPRYNHAACTFPGPDGEGLMTIGGLESSYCSMNLFKLIEKEVKSDNEAKTKVKEVNLFEKFKEKKEQSNLDARVLENENTIKELEKIISKEKDATTDLEKQIFALEEELDNLQNNQNNKVGLRKREVDDLDEEYFMNYEATKALFSMIPIEQLILTEINMNNGMLEEVIQKSESYLIALDKLYLAFSKYKFDDGDELELRLKDIYDNSQDDVHQLRDQHKNSLYLMKTVYDDYATLTKKVENEIHRQRQRILEIDKNYKEILVQSETEDN